MQYNLRLLTNFEIFNIPFKLDISKNITNRNKNIKLSSKKIRLEGIRFLSRVEIELEDSGGLNLPKQNTQQTMSHQSPQSALSSPKQEEAPKEQGNRRLRRAEAKMARKNARKK